RWLHVQPYPAGTPSYIVHEYTADPHLTNWTVTTASPIFVNVGQSTHGFPADQVADLRSVPVYFGGKWIAFYDLDYNAGPFVAASVVSSSFSGALSNVFAGTFVPPRSLEIRLGANQTITNNVETLIRFAGQDVVVNDGFMCEPANGAIDIISPGTYEFSLCVQYNTSFSGGTSLARIYVNSNEVMGWQVPGNTAGSQVTGNYQQRLKTGDKVYFKVFQNSGANQTLAGLWTTVANSRFGLTYLHQ
ncbi:MAG: hypothetical protein KGL39_50160, partial [Patescibacteria group bacterium]|nr:hypothetical protein [Patescibacteria group bacterium]